MAPSSSHLLVVLFDVEGIKGEVVTGERECWLGMDDGTGAPAGSHPAHPPTRPLTSCLGRIDVK